MRKTTPPARAQRGIVRSRLLSSLVGVIALAIMLPGLAQAAPVTVIPGLPPIEVPDVPGLPTPSEPTTPSSPTPPPSTTETPERPAPPDVRTNTGYIAVADDHTKQLTWWKDDEVVQVMPISMGSDRFPTPNGVYYVKERYRDMYMDSSTYGVPVDSPDGYRTYVEYAVRMSWSGIFTHAAPWSVEQQGVSNVSHGCLNLNTENAKWIYDNVPEGTPIIVANTIGPDYDGN